VILYRGRTLDLLVLVLLAVVTLYPLFQPDVLPFRSLTFAPDTGFVKIGRASKREAKGLVPAHHNALFESRVMSRDHAQLRVSFDKKVGDVKAIPPPCMKFQLLCNNVRTNAIEHRRSTYGTMAPCMVLGSIVKR
jgi:hypothetical protein